MLLYPLPLIGILNNIIRANNCVGNAPNNIAIQTTFGVRVVYKTFILLIGLDLFMLSRNKKGVRLRNVNVQEIRVMVL